MATDTQHSTWIDLHSKEFTESVNLLYKRFADSNYQGIPLCLTCGLRCFASTTATTLLALHHIKRLPDEMRVKFHEALFAYKNGTAWDSSEVVSSWATSLAIWALLGTRYQGDRLAEIKNAALWLVNQLPDEGWGYNPHDSIDLLTTCTALHALKLVLDTSALKLTNSELGIIRKARRNTLESIRKLGQKKRGMVYWTGQTEAGTQADPTSTLCAIWALHEAKSFDNDKVISDTKLINGGILYLRKALHKNAQPRKTPIWPFEKVIIRPPTAGEALVIVSFTPAFIIPLLAMQRDPSAEICLAPLRWLQQNRLKDEQGWGHKNYGHPENHAISYTTAYALWAIANWSKYTPRHYEQQCTKVKKVENQRNFALGLLLIISISLLLNFTAPFIFTIPIQPFMDWFYSTNNVLQFISALLGVLPLPFMILKFVDDQFFDKRFSNFFSRITSKY